MECYSARGPSLKEDEAWDVEVVEEVFQLVPENVPLAEAAVAEAELANVMDPDDSPTLCAGILALYPSIRPRLACTLVLTLPFLGFFQLPFEIFDALTLRSGFCRVGRSRCLPILACMILAEELSVQSCIACCTLTLPFCSQLRL